MHALTAILPWAAAQSLPLWAHLICTLAFAAGILILVQAPLIAAADRMPFLSGRRIFRLGYAAGQWSRELKAGALTVALDALLLTAAFRSSLIRADESHFVSTFFISFVWLETWFYFSHRAMHTRLLWPVHRLHHESKVTGPLTSMTLSLTEGFALIGGLTVGVGLISRVYPVSLAGIAAYFAFLQIINVFGHGNIEIFPPRVHRLLFFWNTPTHHALHHARVKGHYGLMTPLLDRWLGTEFADYHDVQRLAYMKQGLASLGQRLNLGRPAAKALSAPTIEEIRAGRLSLAADWPSASLFRPLKVYQAPEVAAWLEKEIAAYPGEVGLDLLMRFDAQQCAWYLKRENEIFGPMSLKDLSELKRSEALRAGDLCFSLKWRLRAQPKDLPMSLAADPAAAPELFLNRRHPRTNLQRMVTIRTSSASLRAMTMDVSPLSSAVYVKSRLRAGDRLRLDFDSFGQDESFSTEAVIVNVQAFGDGFRCGLMFINLERRATALWGSLIKKSRAAAA
jgi:sterol desaturase/sphingolipid hydroxylase (fatty acid hydroxylase superfamily)